MSDLSRFWQLNAKRTRDTKIASRDEGARDGKDFTGGEWDVERLRDRATTVEDVEDGLVTSLNSQDGSGSRQQHWVGDEMCGTEVRSNSEVLDETGGSGHGWHIVQCIAKVELTGGQGGAALRRDGGLNGWMGVN